MNLTLTFAISGIAVALLLMAKRLEQRHGRTFILLDLISRGDHKARELSQTSTVMYASFKERAEFLLKKQLPLYVKSHWYKLSALLVEVGKRYLHKIRDSRLLHAKQEGLSEYFSKLKEVEKGNGSIEEDPIPHPED